MEFEELHNRIDRNLSETKLGGLADTFFWAPVLRATMLTGPDQLLNALGLRKQNGTIFTGADGNGRHTTAEALAASLCNPKAAEPYHFLRIAGWELDFENACDVYALMDAIVGCGKETGRLCLLLDSPEDSRWGLPVQRRLVGLLDAEEFSLYLILICGEQKMTAPELRRRLRVCHCPPPTYEQREAWFADKLFTPVPIPMKSMTYRDLAKKTGGLSWKQLNDLVDSMRQLLAWRHFMQYHDNGGKLSELERALQGGAIELDEKDIAQLLLGIPGQNPPPYAGQILQMPVVAAVQKDALLPDEKQESYDWESARKLADFKKHPERMTVDQLLDF